MAPDINSLPPSPYRSQVTSTAPRRPSQPRRLSERVASPTASLFSSTPPPRSPISSSAFNQPPPHEDNTGVDPGPGPLRHPRPLTAADLHMQLEKEQEAVVNRLTRELTALRQQTASVNSTTSSTSASTGIAESGPQEGHANYLSGGSAHPTPSRRHRSSSNLSSRGNTSAGAGSGSASTVNTTAGLAGSGIAPPRDSSVPYTYSRGDLNLSRQSSVASRRSEASSPSLSSSLLHQSQGEHNLPLHHHHRHSHSNSTSAPTTAGASARSGSMSISRYDDAAHARAELEMVKAENEALKGRIRELERIANRRGEDTASRDVTATTAVQTEGDAQATVDMETR